LSSSDRARRKCLLDSLGGLVAQHERANAHDLAKVMPRTYRASNERDKLRVLEFACRGGGGVCGRGIHSHHAHWIIVLSDWQGIATTLARAKV